MAEGTVQNSGIDRILISGALDRLRKAYDRAALRELSTTTLNGLFADGKPLVDGAIAQYDAEGCLPAVDRERCIISLLAAARSTLGLSIHIYWGMMEGMSANEVARTLMLTGSYAGIETYTLGLLRLRNVLTALADLCEKGSTNSKDVVRELMTRAG